MYSSYSFLRYWYIRVQGGLKKVTEVTKNGIFYASISHYCQLDQNQPLIKDRIKTTSSVTFLTTNSWYCFEAIFELC